jgi:ribosomal protein S3AE
MMVNKELANLHPNEVALINKWRTKYRYSEITIIIQDGVPLRIKQVVTTETLTNNKHDRQIKN